MPSPVTWPCRLTQARSAHEALDDTAYGDAMTKSPGTALSRVSRLVLEWAYLGVWILSAVVLICSLSGCQSHESSAIASLTGERLEASSGIAGATSQCSGKSGKFTFQVRGRATGPYSGAFTETGAVTVVASTPTSLSATFTIFAARATIEGRLTLDAHSATKPKEMAFCLPRYGLAFGAAKFSVRLRTSDMRTALQVGSCDFGIIGGSVTYSNVREEFRAKG